IRLSDKTSPVRPREGLWKVSQADHSQHVVQVLIGESCCSPTPQLVLPPKPLTEPMPRVAVDGSIRGADRAEAAVVRPSPKHPLPSRPPVFDIRPEPFPAGLVADLPLETVALLRRRLRPDVGLTRLRRPASPDRIPQEVECLLGHPAPPRL